MSWIYFIWSCIYVEIIYDWFHLMVEDMAIVVMYFIFRCDFYVEIYSCMIIGDLFVGVTTISYLFIVIA